MISDFFLYFVKFKISLKMIVLSSLFFQGCNSEQRSQRTIVENPVVAEEVDLSKDHHESTDQLSEDSQKSPAVVLDPLPYDQQGEIKNYVRSIPEDQWSGNSQSFDRAFDYLTDHGLSLFNAALEYVELQQKEQYYDLSLPHRSLDNIFEILKLAQYKLDIGDDIDTAYFLDLVTENGGKVFDLPLVNDEKASRRPLIDFLNEHFYSSIPSGAIIVSCSLENCLEKTANSHSGIVGDKNKFGEIMIYHNNWLTPNFLSGVRIPYMVTMKNLYEKLRPSQWMPTPWLYLLKDDQGTIIDIASITPQIDDLDPLSGRYFIKLVLLPKISQEIAQNKVIDHHYQLSSGNHHINLFSAEHDWELCFSQHSLEEIVPKLSPDGETNTYVLEQLKEYPSSVTFLDRSFEFAPIEKSNGWVSALIYDYYRYWGGLDQYGPIWIPLTQVRCDRKRNFYQSERYR